MSISAESMRPINVSMSEFEPVDEKGGCAAKEYQFRFVKSIEYEEVRERNGRDGRTEEMMESVRVDAGGNKYWRMYICEEEKDWLIEENRSSGEDRGLD